MNDHELTHIRDESESTDLEVAREFLAEAYAGQQWSADQTRQPFSFRYTAVGDQAMTLRTIRFDGHLDGVMTPSEDFVVQWTTKGRGTITTDAGTIERERVEGRIDIRNLSFSYPGADHAVLSDVNVTIEPGQMVAIVGRSGSGKSTLANLLPRFYHHRDGQILIDGVDVEKYTLRNLRRHIALVTQQVVLFNDTITANIAYGDLADTPREAVERAAEAAYAREFIDRLPQGFDTLVGENGVLLSGGQRQRLAIARALLKDAPILILDEATSALDTESERHIQAALDKVMEGRTTLVIAHRLSTIEKADLILVMDQGRIVERGTHSELLAANGHYARLHAVQFREAPEDQA